MSYVPYFFTDFVPDQTVRYQVGFATIALVSANFLLNILMMIPSLVLRIKRMCLNLMIKIRARLLKAKKYDKKMGRIPEQD